MRALGHADAQKNGYDSCCESAKSPRSRLTRKRLSHFPIRRAALLCAMEHCAHVLVLLFILVSYSTIAVAQIQWAPYSPDAQSTFYEPPASSGIKRGILNPFVITWLNAAPQPMQDALFYAANTILASLLDFQVTIRVQANYTSLQANYLGFAGPSAFCPVTLGGTTAYSIPAIRDNQAG